MTLPPLSAALLRWLRRFSELTIVVWGDFVADEFVAGEIVRVSREAPVLILKRRSRQIVPGGAGNAAMNLAALGVNVRLVGALGDDEPGERLRECFRGSGMDTAGLVRLRRWATPTKTRILAHHAHTAPQQVVRLDQEPEPHPPATQQRMAVRARRAARHAAAVVVSDYGYGAVTPELAVELRSAMPMPALVTVDARYQIAAYRGLSAATPNENELEAALGVKIGAAAANLEQAGRRLRQRLGCTHLLVTRGRDGMALFEERQPLRQLAVHGSRRALDVTGAGDTVIAVFTAALAAGASGWDAAALANYAAGLVVMKPGTATVSPAELEAALRQ